MAGADIQSAMTIHRPPVYFMDGWRRIFESKNASSQASLQ